MFLSVFPLIGAFHSIFQLIFFFILFLCARYMAMHGQVWDPKKDGDGLGKLSCFSFFHHFMCGLRCLLSTVHPMNFALELTFHTFLF